MNSSWADRADRVRHLPLAPLAASLGYVPDPRQRTRWKRDGSLLSLQGDRFYDHLRQRGGGGAIDLVMHASDCGFQAAVRFLESASPHPHSPRVSDHFIPLESNGFESDSAGLIWLGKRINVMRFAAL